jgi:Family of unknown function (DUF5719)
MTGTRAATHWWRRPPFHIALALVVLSGAGVAATAWAPQERGPDAATTTEVPVSETLVACPGLRSREGFTESTVAAATPPSISGVNADASGEGTVRTLTRNIDKDRTLIQLDAPGDLSRYTGRNGERDSVTGGASGALAPGFSVTQTERTVDGKGRGLASTQCLPTGNSFWFVGAGTDVGQRGTLVLTNPEAATASVDVVIYGRDGVIDAPGARGIEVPARSRVEVRLDEVAPGEPVLAMNAQVRVGRLSAAVTETDVFGFEPRGTDWISGTEPPSQSLVVPGFPRVDSDRNARLRLDVVAPQAAAVVTLQLITPDGTFTPEDVSVLDVPAGAVKSVDLNQAFAGEPGAVLVTADAPVTAGARVFLSDPQLFGDSLYLAASLPLTAPAVVPDNLITNDLDTRLILSAPEQAATVTVSSFAGASGKSGTEETVDIPAGATRQVTVDPGKNLKRFGLVIAPQDGSGPVYGVRMLDEQGPRGPLVTSYPLRTARLTATVPVTVPDVAAGTIDTR